MTLEAGSSIISELLGTSRLRNRQGQVFNVDEIRTPQGQRVYEVVQLLPQGDVKPYGRTEARSASQAIKIATRRR